MDCAGIEEHVETSGATKRAEAECFRRRSGRWLALVMLAGLAAYGGRIGYLNHRANWGVVEPGKIYRSATIPASLVRQKLQENKIGVIVFLSRDPGNDPDLAAERKAAGELAVPILNFPMRGDGVANPDQYTEALSAVWNAEQQGKPVLIHCHSGSERTGGVVAMYRTLIEGKSSGEAYAEMLRYGFRPTRNKTLLPFLDEHVGEWAMALVDRKIISHVPTPLPKITP